MHCICEQVLGMIDHNIKVDLISDIADFSVASKVYPVVL